MGIRKGGGTVNKRLRKILRNALIAGFLLVFIVGPLCLYAALSLGWPPVIGNLYAAGQLRTYAAQVYPEAEAEGCWAGYNLVDGFYSLDFQDPGGEIRSLRYSADDGQVMDRQRSEALEQELDTGRAFRMNGLWRDGYRCYLGTSWSPRTPGEVHVFLRVDVYDPLEAPVPDEEAMRERMASEIMKAYNALSPLTPVHTVSVHYSHAAQSDERGGCLWHSITVDLPEDTPLTEEMILSGTLVSR